MKKLFKRIENKYILNKTQFELLLPKLLDKMDFDIYCKDSKWKGN